MRGCGAVTPVLGSQGERAGGECGASQVSARSCRPAWATVRPWLGGWRQGLSSDASKRERLKRESATSDRVGRNAEAPAGREWNSPKIKSTERNFNINLKLGVGVGSAGAHL